jgi:hypothetical protein
MNVNSGELRLTAGYSGWGGFLTMYANDLERFRAGTDGWLYSSAANRIITGTQEALTVQGGPLTAAHVGRIVLQGNSAQWTLSDTAGIPQGSRIGLLNVGGIGASVKAIDAFALHRSGANPQDLAPGQEIILPQLSYCELIFYTSAVAVLVGADTWPSNAGNRDFTYPIILSSNGNNVPTTSIGNMTLLTGALQACTLSPMAAGSVLTFSNDIDGASRQITGGGGLVLVLAGTVTQGTRTLAPGAIANVWFRTTTLAFVSGAGVT